MAISNWEAVKDIAQNDLEALKRAAEVSYGDLWKRRVA